MDIICDYRDCTNCQACKNACPVDAISMLENERGFFYPTINQDVCINCGKCQKLCPALNRRVDFKEPLNVFAGWIKDKDICHYSTSGGVAYAISKKIIEEGGVVCGCRWNKDHAEHTFAETINDLRLFQGSKYAQSDMGDCFKRTKKYLDEGRRVLFVGTGCHVAGIKSFLGKDYDSLVTVDLLCHGVPSQKALRDRIKTEEEKEGKRLVDMRFRDKKEDIFHTYCKYTFEDGTSNSYMVFQDSFFCGFVTNHLLRPNCFECQYAQEKRVSDITLADFWGYTPSKFSFLKFRAGVNMVLANTPKGLALIGALSNVKKEERPISMAKAGNRNLNRPQQKPRTYDDFWQRYTGGEKFSELAKQYFPPKQIPVFTGNSWKLYVQILIGEKNMSRIAGFVRNNLRWMYGPIVDKKRKKDKDAYEQKEYQRLEKMSLEAKRVFYFGITSHPNLGDMAQHYCIKKWIGENYPGYQLEMFESDVIVNPKITNKFFSSLKKIFKEDDIIVFQSGYCTQDLGGNHPLMHRLVCEYMPDAKILMMPQTIFFKHEENKRVCAENHNKAKNMLFLARDFVSYEMAKDMFPDIKVKAFPDIVTTLIGTLSFNSTHKGVCLCTRNDGEKLYSKEEIDHLADCFEAEGVRVFQKDTQAHLTVPAIRANLQAVIEAEIESYSHFGVTITDRYHGTIFSLCAGTPVVIIKTTDHKVTTGADWFKGVYDDYVYVAKDLDDAYQIAKGVLEKKLDHRLAPYFKENYYDKLRSIFES